MGRGDRGRLKVGRIDRGRLKVGEGRGDRGQHHHYACCHVHLCISTVHFKAECAWNDILLVDVSIPI